MVETDARRDRSFGDIQTMTQLRGLWLWLPSNLSINPARLARGASHRLLGAG